MKQKVVGRRFLMATWSVNICHYRSHDFPLTIVPKGTSGVAEKVETALQDGNNTSRECENVK